MKRLAAMRWFWMPAGAFLITRLAIFFVAYLSMPLIQDSSVPPYHLRPDNILLDVFGSRWDTGFYLSIATEGYTHTGVELPSTAFFPLLPLFIRLVSTFTGDPLTAGVLVSNTALLLAVMLLYRLVRLEDTDGVASRAVWYLLIFPTSLFGSAIYSESLFLLGAIGALYLVRKGYWESAALVGILTALTRLMGILVMPLLLVEWLQQRRTRPPAQRPARWAVLAGLMVPLGTLGFMWYLNANFGDPLAFAQASAAWGRTPQSPLVTLLGLVQRPAEGWLRELQAGSIQLDNWIDLTFVLAFAAIGVILLIRRRWPEGVFVLLGVLLPLSSGLLMSQRRYMWVLFPAYILLAQWGERPWVDRIINLVFIILLGLFTVLFANWYWVG
ncbi:MAG: mannosyltransferase family protein [Anaerolineales bacterium]